MIKKHIIDIITLLMALLMMLYIDFKIEESKQLKEQLTIMETALQLCVDDMMKYKKERARESNVSCQY